MPAPSRRGWTSPIEEAAGAAQACYRSFHVEDFAGPPAVTAPTAYRIAQVHLDRTSVGTRSPEIEHERALAVRDLVRSSHFQPAGCPEGPYHLHVRIADGRLVLDIRDPADAKLKEVRLPLAPLRGIVRDYFIVCGSYHDAVRRASPAQIEAIDVGRRSLHNEGAEILQDRLRDRIDMDIQTARRLFTLVCALYVTN